MNDFDPNLATEEELAGAAAEHGPTRERLMNTEVAMRALGLLIMCGGALLTFAALSLWAYDVVEAAKGLGFGAFVFTVGRWLRQLQPAARNVLLVVAAALSVYAFLGVIELDQARARHVADIVLRSLGSAAVATFLLVLLWSNKASEVFAAHYRDVVVPATPDARFAASKGMKLFAIVLTAALAFAVARAVMA